MKRVFTLLFLIIGVWGLQSCGTITPVEIEPTVKVVKLEGKSQGDLYIRSNTWMVETFNNAESVIQFSDKENGIVTGKYLLSTSGLRGSGMSAKPVSVFALIKIQVKDGAAKITVSPDSFSEYSMDKRYYTKAQAQGEVDVLILSFESAIGNTESSDW